MEEKNSILKNSQIIILGVCIALATIAASVIFSQALVKIKKFSTEVINVTGSAERKIKSDFIVWNAKFSRRELQMMPAYQKLQEDLKTVIEQTNSSEEEAKKAIEDNKGDIAAAIISLKDKAYQRLVAKIK